MLNDELTPENSIALLERELVQLSNDNIPKEIIIKTIAERLVKWIDKGPDTFYWLMYRLDISERKLKEIISRNNESGNGSEITSNIAEIIYNRQLEKEKSRREHKAFNRQNDDPDLSW